MDGQRGVPRVLRRLVAGDAVKRGQPLRQRSTKRVAEDRQRSIVMRIVRERDRDCRAAARVPDVRCAGPRDGHEIIPRSRWRAGFLEPSNVLLVCRAHHDWIHDNPIAARDLGLLA